MDQGAQLVVADLRKFNADPAARAHVGWKVERVWPFREQLSLHSGGRGQPDSDVVVAVVMVRKHRKHTLGREECGLAMRELLDGTGIGEADLADSFDHI